jgi:hypothetical protein
MNDKKVEKGLTGLIEALTDGVDEFEYYRDTFSSCREMMETFFSNFFEKTEGTACSHDKAVHVVNRILESLDQGEWLTLYDTYDLERHPQMAKCFDKVAYWCPKKMKNAKEAADVFRGMLSLNFGVMIKYCADEVC